MMFRKGLLLILIFGILTLKGSVSLPFNLISAFEKEDILEEEAEKVVKEAERIFEETEGSLDVRRNRIYQFSKKITKIFTAPFIKVLTKVTLMQMEVICSTIDDFESASFATFPQAYILLEVLGKKNVDSGLMSKAIKNKRNDWKFRRLIAEIIGELHLKEAKDPMMEVIIDKSDNQSVRSRCIKEVPLTGETYKGEPIGNYILHIFEEEKELRPNAARALGYLKYNPAVDVLLEHIEKDTSKISKIVMVRALGNIGDKRALPEMFSLLRNKELRGYVAEQLGKIGGDQVVDTLMNLFENDKDSFVRYCAGVGLALSENERAYDFLIKRKAGGALGEAASYGSIKALEAIKEIGTPGAIKKLRWISSDGSSASKKIKNKAKIILKEIEGEE